MTVSAHTTPNRRALIPALQVQLASTVEQVLASQRLRYNIFALEQGARLASGHEGIDRDEYDAFCEHIIVSVVETGEVVGSTRILTHGAAQRAGGFYSETEFDLGQLLPHLSARTIEIGRTCIHPHFRNGAGIGMLWSGLAQFMIQHQVEYLFGCASVSLADQGAQALAIMQEARSTHLSPDTMRVTPRLPLTFSVTAVQAHMPPLLKAYLKLGAWVAGEPCIDPDFNVADLFILLDMRNLNTRYHQHFMQSSVGSPRTKAGLLQAA